MELADRDICEAYDQLMNEMDPDQAAAVVAVRVGWADNTRSVHWTDIQRINDMYDEWLNEKR